MNDDDEYIERTADEIIRKLAEHGVSPDDIQVCEHSIVVSDDGPLKVESMGCKVDPSAPTYIRDKQGNLIGVMSPIRRMTEEEVAHLKQGKFRELSVVPVNGTVTHGYDKEGEEHNE